MALALEERVRKAADSHLAEQGHVCAIDVLRGIGFLDQTHYFAWVNGRAPFLEGTMSASQAKISAALQAFEEWGRALNLRDREVISFSATRHSRQLRFSDDPERSTLYSRRFFSPLSSDAEVDRFQARVSSPPDLVVFEIVRESKCSACGCEIPTGAFLFMEAGDPHCLPCAELGGLVYLPAGDRKLSRRAHQLSPVSAVVLRFSRNRKRYERQGLLVGEEAVHQAELELSTKGTAQSKTAIPNHQQVSTNLSGVAEWDGTTSIYQLQITLLGVTPAVWRRVLVPGNVNLPKLHRVIQRTMGWSNTHLHKFEFKEKRISPEEHLKKFFEPRPAAQPKTLAGRVPNRGSKFKYIYDFGDEWVHEVLVEKLLLQDAATPPLPVCVAGQRACPPEDCGGAWGYKHLLEAIDDPCHPDHEERLDWLGDEFDPEHFDVEAVNGRLKRIKC